VISERIRVGVPYSDARRDRVEREVFARLAAMRIASRADAVLPRLRPRWYAFAAPSAFAAALAVIAVLLVRREAPAPSPSTPSLIVTSVGSSSRFTVGDAVIEAGSDTSVEVARAGDAVTLVLQRGSVDCDVTPRAGRAPFQVISGDVRVEVVGTRFAVRREAGGTRVDVTRGKVRVRTPAGERLLGGGETWTPPATEAAPGTAPVAAASPPGGEPAPGAGAPPSRTPPRWTRREAFAMAQQLEATNPKQAASGYRAIANGRDAWAALALYSLAELHAAGEPAQALEELGELARRFPNATNAEDAAWLRVDLLRRLGRDAHARAAATAYLRAFPRGTYATDARKLATPR
jgi:hypothetical protein